MLFNVVFGLRQVRAAAQARPGVRRALAPELLPVVRRPVGGGRRARCLAVLATAEYIRRRVCFENSCLASITSQFHLSYVRRPVGGGPARPRSCAC